MEMMMNLPPLFISLSSPFDLSESQRMIDDDMDLMLKAFNLNQSTEETDDPLCTRHGTLSNQTGTGGGHDATGWSSLPREASDPSSSTNQMEETTNLSTTPHETVYNKYWCAECSES